MGGDNGIKTNVRGRPSQATETVVGGQTTAPLPADIRTTRERFVIDDSRDLTGAREVAQAFPVAGPLRGSAVGKGDLVSLDSVLSELDHFRDLPEGSQRLHIALAYWGQLNQSKFGRNSGGSDPTSGA